MAVSRFSSLPFEKLTGPTNFATWELRVKGQLAREELTIWLEKEPSDAAESLIDGRALGTILLSVSDNILPHIAFLTTTKAAWDKLQSLYRQTTGGSRVLKHRELFSMRLLSLVDKDRVTHVQKMLSLFNELELLGCPFGRMQKAMIFLSSLGPSYSSFCDSYNNAPDRDLDFDVMCAQLEAWIGLKKNAEKLVSGVKSSTVFGPEGNEQIMCNVICFSCRKPGHTVKNCPFKKGFASAKTDGPAPSAWKARGGKSKNKGGSKQVVSAAAASRKFTQGESSCLLFTNFCEEECKDQTFDMVLDSGASHTIVNNLQLLKSPVPVQNMSSAKLADGRVLSFSHSGSLEIFSLKSTLPKVFYCPALSKHVLSVKQLTELGYRVTFEQGYCLLSNAALGVELKVQQNNGLYVLSSNETNSVCSVVPTANHADFCIHSLHRRLAHRSYRDVIKTAQSVGLKIDSCSCYLECSTCNSVKVRAFPLAKESTRVTKRRLELACIDLCGPFSPSHGGNVYFLCIVDHFSRYGFVYFLKKKSEAEQFIKQWVCLVSNQYADTPLLAIQTDKGGEFSSASLQVFLAKRGIRHYFVNAFCSLENARVERRNLALQCQMKALLHDSQLGNGFWAEAVSYANLLYNSTFCSSIQNIPHVLFHGTKPDLKSLRVFGCRASVLIHRQQRLKRSQHWFPGRFLGFEGDGPSCRFLDLSHKNGVKIVVSRSATFCKNEGWEHLHLNKDVLLNPLPPVSMKDEATSVSLKPDAESSKTVASQTNLEPAKVEEETVPVSAQSQELQPTPSVSSNQSAAVPASGRLKRQRDDSGDLSDTQRTEEEVSADLPRRSKRTVKPPDRLQVSNVSVTEYKEPKSFSEVAKRPAAEKDLWLAAMQKEFDCLIKHDVLEQSHAPENANVVGCRWVFKRKTQTDGSYIYRARLVAQGFTQVENCDYDLTFAPTVKPETIRLALGIAAKRNYVAYHWDIETAYLYAPLDHSVFMRAIPGFEQHTTTGVYKLKRSLYGLKQSARNWSICLNKKLQSLGFVRSDHDPCLYWRGSANQRLFLLTFVDDLLILAPSTDQATFLFKSLSAEFKVKDLGQVQRYLGVQVSCSDGMVCLSQKEKILELLERTKMSHAKGVATPMVPDFNKLPKGEDFANHTLYRSVIGSLQYLAMWTRPDIAYATNVLSRRVANPTTTDWQGVKRILRYLKATVDKQLQFSPNNNLLKCFVDSSFADLADKTSCTGFVIGCLGIPIVWKSRKQRNVSLSTMEAEYAALSDCLVELEWIKSLVNDFISCDYTIPIFCDSQSCIALAESESLRSRTKYVSVRYANVRNLVQSNVIVLEYVESEQNPADVFTKPLVAAKLEMLCKKMFLF